MADSVRPRGNVFDDLVAARIGRRELLGGCLGGRGTGLPQRLRRHARAAPAARCSGFTSVPISRADTVVVPEGYTWQVVNAWGDPIMPGAPEFKPDASQSRRGAGDAVGHVPRRHALLPAAQGLRLLRRTA